MKVAFLHDSPLDYDGGGEISSRLVVDSGIARGHQVMVYGQGSNLFNLWDHDLIILSNIWRFSRQDMAKIMAAIAEVPYVKYEHDHRSLDDPIEKPEHPASLAKKIFSESILNVFLSPDHLKDHQEVLECDGVCVPPLVSHESFKPVPELRVPRTALVPVPFKSRHPVGYKPADDCGAELAAFMADPTLKFTVIDEPVPFEQMPALYASHEYMVHLPQGKWACERTIFEAALCGCKVITGPNAEGVSWEKGFSDQDKLRSWIATAPKVFWDQVEKKFVTARANALVGYMFQDEIEWLYETAKGMETIVEIGSYRGKSTYALLSGCQGQVFAVDPWMWDPHKGEPYREFLKNVGHFYHITPLKMTGKEASTHEAMPPKVEMVFIDATHTKEAVLDDLDTWAGRATKLVCGHDYCFPEVREAVHEFFGDSIRVHNTIWYHEVQDA